MVHEETVELHIQDSDFERIINNLEATNDAIKKCLSNTNVNFTPTKPDDAIKRILQRDSEFNWWEWESLTQEQSGEKLSTHTCTVQTYDGTQGWDSTYLPLDTETPIDVNCFAGCLSPFFTIVLDQGDTRVETGFGIGGEWSTTISPYYLGATCIFKMQTTCSYGGRATFKWRTEI